MIKFFGKYAELQERVRRTKIPGAWRDIDKRQYRAENGAILNWWESTGTVSFQGQEPAASEFREAYRQTAEVPEHDAAVGPVPIHLW